MGYIGSQEALRQDIGLNSLREPNGFKQRHEPADEIDMMPLIQALWRRRLLVLAGMVFSFLAAGFWALRSPYAYEATALVELGRVINSRNAERTKFIEDQNSVAIILKSDVVLTKMRDALGLGSSISSLKKAVGINKGFKDINAPAYLMELMFQGNSPKAAVDGVQFLSNYVVSSHEQKFEDALALYDTEIESLDQQIKNIEPQKESVKTKMRSAHNQIKENRDYYKMLMDQAQAISKDIIDNKRHFSELVPNQIKPIEFLYFQTSIQNSEKHLTDLNKEMNEVVLRNGEIEKEIGELNSRLTQIDNDKESIKMVKLNLENDKLSCVKTHVASAPIMPEGPLSRHTIKKTLSKGLLGTVVFVVLAIVLEIRKGARIIGTETAS